MSSMCPRAASARRSCVGRAKGPVCCSGDPRRLGMRHGGRRCADEQTSLSGPTNFNYVPRGNHRVRNDRSISLVGSSSGDRTQLQVVAT